MLKICSVSMLYTLYNIQHTGRRKLKASAKSHTEHNLHKSAGKVIKGAKTFLDHFSHKKKKKTQQYSILHIRNGNGDPITEI